MKFIQYLIGLTSAATLLPLIPAITPSANACSVTAPTHQLAITGSRNGATQVNQIATGHDGNCLGNNIVSPTNQVYVGTDPVTQYNQGNYYVGGGEYNQTGVSGPVIEVAPTIQNQIYSPHLDPNFNPAGHLLPH